MSTQLFVGAASEFCAWAESQPGEPILEARVALGLLLRLYAGAIDLEVPAGVNYELDGASLSHQQWVPYLERFGALPFGYYSVVYDPHVVPPEQPVVGDIADDLADIYRDLREGFSLEREGHHAEAIATWQLSFRNHWGRHAASAIRALHTWFEREHAW